MSPVSVRSLFWIDDKNPTWIGDNAAKATSWIDSIESDWELFGVLFQQNAH